MLDYAVTSGLRRHGAVDIAVYHNSVMSITPFGKRCVSVRSLTVRTLRWGCQGIYRAKALLFVFLGSTNASGPG